MTQFKNDLDEGVRLCLDLSWIWNGHVHDLVEGFGGIQNQLAEVVGVCPPSCYGTSRPFGCGCFTLSRFSRSICFWLLLGCSSCKCGFFVFFFEVFVGVTNFSCFCFFTLFQIVLVVQIVSSRFNFLCSLNCFTLSLVV